ncbi:MAG: sporulation membrane protein YtaF [Clostridia bacterium]|nr:sporulation membrane protein YtaF [Clostridia bacterium]
MPVLLYILSVNSDSIGVGISYGVRKIHISCRSLLIIVVFSILCSSIALTVGSLLSSIMSPNVGSFLGDCILLAIGFWILLTSFRENTVKTRTFSIKPLGITISIMREPSLCDFDSSSHIDAKEAIYLAMALSLDSVAIGLGVGVAGFARWYLPIIIGVSQLAFLELGKTLGILLAAKLNIPQKVWSILAGILLIILAVI